MFLSEVFDSKIQFREERDGDDIEYYGKLPDGTYLKVMFNRIVDKGEYELVFARGKRPDYRDARFDKIGLGGEIEVFSAVLQCLATFLQQHKPDLIQFNADTSKAATDPRNGSRASLYARLIQRYLPPQWELFPRKYEGFQEYNILRKGSQAYKYAKQENDAFPEFVN